MSVKLMSQVFQLSDQYTSGTRLVLLALADHCSDDGACWPNYQTIAEKAAISKRSVMRIINDLEDQGIVKRVKRKNKDGGSTSNVFWLHLPKQQEEGGSDTTVTPGHRPDHQGSDAKDTRGATPVSPPENPVGGSLEPSCEPPHEQHACQNGQETQENGVQKQQTAANTPLQKIADEWNEMAQESGLPTIRTLTDSRKQKIRQRWKSKAWRDDYKKALAEIPRSNFLTGHSRTGWIANFDWFIRPDSVTKILEGAYTDQHEAGTKDLSPEQEANIRDILGLND